jgi:hypothetical protein
VYQQPPTEGLQHYALFHLVDSPLEQITRLIDGVLDFLAHASQGAQVLECEADGEVLQGVGCRLQS